MRALGDGLDRRRILFGIAQCIGDLIPLQGQRVRQNHFYRRAYVEKKVMRSPDQHQTNGQAYTSANGGSNHRIFSLFRGTRYARGKAPERTRRTTWRNAAGESSALRGSYGMTNQRSHARPDKRPCN